MIIRTYSELLRIPTFEERYKYLKLDAEIGMETFGFERSEEHTSELQSQR